MPCGATSTAKERHPRHLREIAGALTVPTFAEPAGMPPLKRQVPYGPIAISLYMLSLVLPAIVSIHKPLLWGAPHDELMFGIQCLLIGWFTTPWYANLALWLAGIALAYRRPGIAAMFSLAAIGLALTLGLYLNTYVRSPHVGYFAWLASMLTVLIAALARSHRDRAMLDDSHAA
jgi:hypothetical protein